jgi:hypothetical protein
MTVDPELLKAFEQAYVYFNGHNFTDQSWALQMDDLLDDNVKMKQLDDETYHEGKGEVKKYFLQGGNGFDDQATVSFITKDCQQIDDYGFISGFANFVDLNGAKHIPPSPSRVIAYSFTYSKKSGRWKAVHLWGAYVTPKYPLYK